MGTVSFIVIVGVLLGLLLHLYHKRLVTLARRGKDVVLMRIRRMDTTVLIYESLGIFTVCGVAYAVAKCIFYLIRH